MKRLLLLLLLPGLGLIAYQWFRAPAGSRPQTSQASVATEVQSTPAKMPESKSAGFFEAETRFREGPATREEQWRTVSPLAEMAAFQEWSASYTAEPDAGKVAAGIELAQARRDTLLALIQSDPEKALASTVPEAVRRAMPAEIRALLEEKVDARGDLIVTAAAAGDLPPGKRAETTEALLDDGRRLEAFVYGNREFRPSRENVPLHGIALDGLMAVSQWPGRVLEPLEAAEARKALPADPECPASGLKTAETGTEVALQTGREVTFYCGPAHAQEVLSRDAAAEAIRPPGLGVRASQPQDAASGGAGQTVPSALFEGDHSWTTGTKRILAVRVEFEGTGGYYYDYSDLDTQDCEDIVAGIRAAFLDWSYGRLNVLPVQSGGSRVSPFVKLDQSADDYEGDEIGDIWDEVRDKVEDDHNIDPDDYDFILVLAGNAPITDEDDEDETVWWGGLGRIGEGLSFIRMNDDTWTSQERIDNNVRVSLHELGHNLGLYHSSNIFTVPQLDGGSVSTGKEYGDRYDNMGKGGAGGDFNARYKLWLNWLDNGNVPVAATDGVYTIREHDLEEKSGIRGLQVAPEPVYLPIGNLKQVFIEYRMHYVEPLSGFPYIAYNYPLRAFGAQIRAAKTGSPKAWLLDATPETPNWEPVPPGWQDADTSGNLDSPLLPGRTFTYSRNGASVYITNLEADPEAGELKVEIQHGPIAGNDPPSGSIAVNTPQGAKNQNILFTANVTDPEDTSFAYHWQIPGFSYDAVTPAVFPNAKSIIVKFPDTGTWAVKCLVSDKHGGTVQLSRSFSVITNQPPVISAISDRTTNEDTALSGIPFTVSDPTTPAGSLSVTASSDNTSLFPAGNIVLGGSGGNRTISLTPAINRHGTAKITLQVSDGALQDLETFEVTVNAVTPGVTLVSAGGRWRYWDADGAPAATWKDSDYDDSRWDADNARFVYPAPTLNLFGWTVLRTPAAPRPACYFRRDFNISSLASGNPVIRFLCDDGMVVYLNGAEIWRHNMPEGAVSHSTRALSTVGGLLTKQWTMVPLDISRLRTGANTLAVEVHDIGSSRGGGDVTFDLSLSLLQTPTVSNITNKFSAEDQPAGPYNFSASEAESPSAGVTFSGRSSNPALVLDSNIKFGFNLPTLQWTVTCLPQPDATGVTEITVKVSDGSSETWEKFNLTVNPVNDPPVVLPVNDVAVAWGELPPLVEIQVADVDSDVSSLTVTAVSSNAAVLPNAGIEVLPGPAPNRRWLRLTPNAGIAAQSNVTVNVSDGTAAGSDVFIFRVSPAFDVNTTDIALVRSGESWRYWANALPADPRGGTVDFTDPSLDDRAWPSGPSQLGYGNDGERTSIPVTPYRVTTYLRKKFTIPSASTVSQLKLRMLRDDGAVVYLNGTRIWTSNMPRVTITATTLAESDVSGAAEDAWQTLTIGTGALVSGSNTLAVELHQSAMPAAFSPGDLTFDFELDGVAAPVDATDVLVPPGGMWSYWDQAAYPDDTWRLATFVEDGWKQGLARLGYGIGGESTVVNDDNEAGTGRNPSVLFRHVFDVADPAAYAALHLYMQRDDGIAVFLNGVRVHTFNVSSSPVPGDFALSEIPSPLHTQWQHYLIDPKRLIPGRNLLAVEVHQSSLSGTDLNFDLQLIGELTGIPPLYLTPAGNDMELSWPAAYNGWNLFSTSDFAAWSPVPQPPLLDGAWIYIIQPNPGTRHFYKLMKP